MTPRNEIVGIDLEAPIEEIIDHIKTSPHTQLAVYKKNIDRVVGFLHLRKSIGVSQPDRFRQTGDHQPVGEARFYSGTYPGSYTNAQV